MRIIDAKAEIIGGVIDAAAELSGQVIEANAQLVNEVRATTFPDYSGEYNVSGGGGSGLTKLATKDLGTISTSSTSAADTGQTLDVEGFDAYDLLICITHTSPHTNNRNLGTIRLVNLAATSNVNTKTGTGVATSTQNIKLSSSGVIQTRVGTTPYGVYVNTATLNTSGTRRITLTIYQRYNSTSSGTINGHYVLDVYGLKLSDLL